MSFIINEIHAVPTELPLHEIARYMGMRSEDIPENVQIQIDKLLPRFLSELQCRACWMEVPIDTIGSDVNMNVTVLKSAHLARALEGCTSAVLFAATIGSAPDRMARSASIISPAKAVLFDAMGSTAIEWFCDELCERLKSEYPEFTLRPRFSPGYGDLSLEFQKELIGLLDTKRKIGLTLSDSLMMLPQKSVTAIVGLRPSNI